jgi:hypothetical protein
MVWLHDAAFRVSEMFITGTLKVLSLLKVLGRPQIHESPWTTTILTPVMLSVLIGDATRGCGLSISGTGTCVLHISYRISDGSNRLQTLQDAPRSNGKQQQGERVCRLWSG